MKTFEIVSSTVAPSEAVHKDPLATYPESVAEVTEIDLQRFFAGKVDKLSPSGAWLPIIRQSSFAPADPDDTINNPAIAAAGHPSLFKRGIMFPPRK